MTVSPEAAAKLQVLVSRLGTRTGGLRFEGYVGSCRGSAPIFKPVAVPVAVPVAGDRELEVAGIRFYIPPREFALFEAAHLDLDDSFMGRGLSLTWPHLSGCTCNCR